MWWRHLPTSNYTIHLSANLNDEHIVEYTLWKSQQVICTMASSGYKYQDPSLFLFRVLISAVKPCYRLKYRKNEMNVGSCSHRILCNELRRLGIFSDLFYHVLQSHAVVVWPQLPEFSLFLLCYSTFSLQYFKWQLRQLARGEESKMILLLVLKWRNHANRY